tara:strand:+ start:9637 stop:11172 length:1536 start_codon:yes stop_codon:yes gene_type:complete
MKNSILFLTLLSATIFLLNFMQKQPIAISPSLGIFDNTLDIGNVKHTGSAIFNEDDQSYTLTGSGGNIWFETDEMRFTWKAIQGDFILRAEVEFIGEGVDPHRKVGWAVRNSLDPHSEMVIGAIHGDGLISLQYRNEYKANVEETVSPDSSSNVIQLARVGDTFYLSTAKKGSQFTTVETTSTGINNEVFAGIYICAHNSDVIEKAVFKNVRITKPAPKDLEQYQQYLGSRLEVLDLETRTRKVLYETEHSIQAPNWSTNGDRLIYNSNGLLFNYHLEDGLITQLNTNFARKNNNDHVLSFDGNLIGISSHNPDDNGNSTIYVLPSEGSDELKQATKSGIGASYLHGISPDNRTVIYTGIRKGQPDIYSADIETMEETQLTNTPGLDDGSEYSSDGKYIYFNSNRTGAMQLWKMNADGTNPTQLTFDKNYNDWFPHISPNGKWIVFVSFGTDVPSGDHPFYKQVTIRLMPVEGGEPEIIAYVYGGQGTINVPSWSPGSRKIAFVSNTGRFF